ncbi:MAG: vWA domain-containing protein [Bdellovibrionota bacterium]
MKILFSLMILLVATISCSPQPSLLVPSPALHNQKVANDAFFIDPKVDILFVIDNSGSMGVHQENLADNIDLFLAAFVDRVQVDYHIGVLTTDMDSNSAENTHCCGNLVGRTKFTDRSTPDGRFVLYRNLLVGVKGSGTEKVFDPIKAALSEPRLSNQNQGFLRPDAHLAVIIITDAEDHSEENSQNLYDFLVRLKKLPEKVLAYGAIIPSDITSCARDEAEVPRRLESFLSMTVNATKNIMSLCDPNFGKSLANLGNNIAKTIASTIFLVRAPILETIEVWYGTQQIPKDPKKGWSYDVAQNAIHLGDDIVWDTSQPSGTKIRISFEPTQFEKH